MRTPDRDDTFGNLARSESALASQPRTEGYGVRCVRLIYMPVNRAIYDFEIPDQNLGEY